MKRTLEQGRFFGRTELRCGHEGMTLSEVRFPPETSVPPHAHERAIFNFVLSGGYTEFTQGREAECDRSRLLFHPVGQVHAERFSSEGARCLVLEFDVSRLEPVLGPAGLDEPAGFPAARWAWVAGRLRRELRERDDLSPFVAEGFLHLLVAGARREVRKRRAGDPVPRFVEQAREILHDRLVESPQLASVAEEVGVHPVRLSRHFRRHYGRTPGEYLRELRIDRARRDLVETDLSLAEIAHRSGFADQSHFTRSFKRSTGWTPGAYREGVTD